MLNIINFLKKNKLNSYYRYTYFTFIGNKPSGYYLRHDEDKLYYVPQHGYFSDNERSLPLQSIYKIAYSNKIYGGTVWCKNHE